MQILIRSVSFHRISIFSSGFALKLLQNKELLQDRMGNGLHQARLSKFMTLTLKLLTRIDMVKFKTDIRMS